MAWAAWLCFLAGSAPAATVLNQPGEIGPSISACWHAPHPGDEITLKMSFKRDGSLLGRPRITYMKASGGADGEAALANSIYEAISDCPPRFKAALGAAIAGRIFLIRFTAARKTFHAAL